MIECERKYLLSKKEYDCLLTAFENEKNTDVQTNYYFDTSDMKLNRNGITLRTRLKDGMYTTTLKRHSVKAKYRSVEKDIVVSGDFNPDVFESSGVFCQGSLVTTRTTLNKDKCYEIVLDKNEYLGMTDYEVEMEYLEGYEEIAKKSLYAILHILADFFPDFDKKSFLRRANNSKSKSQRFFERKNRFNHDTNSQV